MATASAPKTFSGIFLVPGVSKNRRLYTKDMIGRAVARMQARIADPDGLPIAMRSHHDAKDNSRLIVGRVVGVEQLPDGRARYDARWYDTAPARDIAELVQPADGGAPGLRSVSIHGWFIDPKQVEVDGESVTSSTDLEIDFIDFTANPGVTGALIDAPGAPAESAPPRPGALAVYETWEDPMPETDTGQALPVTDEATEAYTAAQKRNALAKGQAMKNPDGEPSYPVKNKSDLRKAIRAVGRGGADHDKIRAHIMDRAAALGLSAMIPDNWNKDGSLKESAGTRFGQVHECYDSMAPAGAGFAIDAYNGPVSLTLRAPSLDPSSLRAVAAAAMDAAMDALGALDPDFDADIDVPGAPAEDTDGDAEDAQDPEAATTDDDEEDYEPGSGCPCGCGCAVPDEMVGGRGCPCACGCEICGAPAPESATPRTGNAVTESRSSFVGEQGPELLIPAASDARFLPQTTGDAGTPTLESAPDDTNTEESAVSETVTPAAEAATTTAAPATPAQAPVFQFTGEQFTQLLAAVRPSVTEAAQAPVVPQDAAPAPATQPVAVPAQEQAPAAESVSRAELAETVNAAVTQALVAAMPTLVPVLRDSIVSQYGLPPRTGIRTAETDRSEKEPTPAELWDKRADLLLGPVGR